MDFTKFNRINSPRSTAEGLKLLTPILLERLANQETVDSTLEQLEDLLVLYEDIIEHTVSFFENKTSHSQWEVRQEGVRILGLLLNGLASKTLGRRVAEATLPILVLLLADQNTGIRETVVTLFNSIEFSDAFQPVLLPGRLPEILQAVATALDGTDRVAACVAKILQKVSPMVTPAVNEDMCVVYPVLEAVLCKLINAVSCDGESIDLSYPIYYLTAFDAVLQCSIPIGPNKGWNEIMLRTAILILDHAEAICGIQFAFAHELNPLWKLCWLFGPVLSQISKNDASQIADRAAAIFLKLLTISEEEEDLCSREIAFKGLSTLVTLVGEGFVKHMPSFWPFFAFELTNFNTSECSEVMIDFLESILIALGPQAMRYWDDDDELVEAIDNLLDEGAVSYFQSTISKAKRVRELLKKLMDDGVPPSS